MPPFHANIGVFGNPVGFLVAFPGTDGSPGSPRPARPTAHDILRERMARHEISGEQYDELMSVLGPDPYGPDAT